ncbi:MAG: RNA-guided endonuclease InsQ/TnpB family protein [Solirubrobacteraceae bacterium]
MSTAASQRSLSPPAATAWSCCGSPRPSHSQPGSRSSARLPRTVSRKPRGSANRRKVTRRLARHHERVANHRKHFIHQVSNGLVKTHDRLVLEDLNVAGMLRNPKLARSISDAAWATLHHQLAYKQAWAGGQLAVADRWFASTQTCSGCGETQRLSLADREFHCGACGLIIDRDLNAAVNLAAWAEQHAKAPDRQADGRDINARREARSGPRSRTGETSLDDAGTERQALSA